MGRLDGKVAFITGATSGIGRVAAELFAAEGAAVAVAGRDGARGEAAVAAIRAAGGRAAFLPVDVGEEASVRAAIDAAVAAFGRLDILYNNAGGSRASDGPVTTADLDEVWRVLRVDLVGTFLCCRHAIPHMARGGGGSIINSASIMGAMGLPNRDGYTAAKGGVIALTRALAVEFARDRIRANVLVAGAVTTERVLAFYDREPALKTQWDAYLLGLAEPVDVARAALFLASEESRRTTGQMIPVDSGILIS